MTQPNRYRRRLGRAVRNLPRSGVPAALLVLAISSSVGCGRAPNAADLTSPSPVQSSPSPGSSPSPSPNATPTAAWQVYSDPQFGFKISYPPDFVVPSPDSNVPRPWLRELRAVDQRFIAQYPPGQVEFGLYTEDAASPTAWVQKHSGPCGSPGNQAFFWDKAGNLQAVAAAGHAAVSFDWDMSSCGSPIVVRETVLFLSSGFVFRFDWWASDANYLSTLQPIADQMLASLNG